MGTLTIRPLTADDKPSVVRILRQTPEFLPAEVTIALELIDAYLADGVASGYHILVAEDDRAIVGYICYGPTPLAEGTWDIYWIAVDTQKQSQGFGRVLMEEVEKHIAIQSGRLVVIETSAKPAYNKTRSFYRTRGYTEIARIPDFYAAGDDKLILVKRLRQ